jgi:hypothetical protein
VFPVNAPNAPTTATALPTPAATPGSAPTIPVPTFVNPFTAAFLISKDDLLSDPEKEGTELVPPETTLDAVLAIVLNVAKSPKDGILQS